MPSRPKPGFKIRTEATEQPKAPTPPIKLDDHFETTFAGKLGEKTIVSTDTLESIQELGRGAYGVVEKVRHRNTGHVFAVKRIRVTINDEEQRRMLIELKAAVMTDKCPHLVACYGAMFRDGDVWICMEMMDTSLDKFYRMCVDLKSKMPERCVSRIAYCTVKGLDFMKQEMSLMHRDVKPSNILASRDGQVKICDFGISGHLTNSVAKTVNAGCKPYMAPERIDGDHRDKYDVRSDVWSLAITVIEVATGCHPYAKWKTPFEQLKQVVAEPAPTLPEDEDYTNEFRDFLAKALQKDFHARPKYEQLLSHPFLADIGSQVPAEELGQFIGTTLDAYEEERKRLLGE